jgi:hypothetical protein
MKNAKQYVPLLVALILVLLRHLAFWCSNSKEICPGGSFLDQIFLSVINPIYFYSLAFLATGLVLIFVTRTIFTSWFHFAIGWLLISVILVTITPIASNGWIPLYFVGRSEVAYQMGILFTIISLALIGWKTFRNRHPKQVAKA